MPVHFRILLSTLLLASVPFVAGAADEHLATAKLAKAAVACQKAIAQVGAKVLTDKLKALDACTNAALTCVQTKQDKAVECLTKAGGTCAKQLAKAALALSKAQAKIVATKSCAVELRLPDLLSADGLGLGDLAGECQTDFGLDVCGGLDALAECVVRARDRAAGAIFGEARPRASELLTILPSPPPAVEGLPSFTGCATCGAPVPNRKAVEACGKALTKARQGLGASLEKTLAGCAQKVLACVQTKSGDPKCLTGATAGCDKAAGKISAALAKFAAGVAQKCDAAVVAFSMLSADSGLGLASLVATCTNAPTDAAGVAACLQARAQCTTAELVRETFTRAGAFAESGHLGALAPDATATCPVPQMAVVTRTATAPRVVFGSIGKFLKLVRRPIGSASGSIASGGRPSPSLGAGRGLTRVSGPVRVTFGGVGKIQFRYRTGAALGRGARVAADPPTLIIAIQRADVALDNHIEVPLDPAPGALEVDDEIDVTYQDTIPGCAFTLALATRIDGVVSDYTPLPQTVDTELPPTPSLTVTRILDETGDGAGNTLNDALGLATDPAGSLYVTGAASNNVFRRTSTGVVTQIIDLTGDGVHSLMVPVAATVLGSDDVFVATQAAAPNSFVFDIAVSSGAITKILDASGDGGSTFSAAAGIAATTDTVFVSGGSSDNVFAIAPGGIISQVIDASGDGVHALSEPAGIAVDDATGAAYVAGRLSNNVFKLSPNGDPPPTQIIDATGDGVHALGGAVDVAVDSASNVYVVGEASHNAFRITPAGVITQVIDASGDGNGGLANPVAIATQGTDVYVLSSASNPRAYKITADGTITQIIGPEGDGVHSLGAPGDITTDDFGNVYVSDRVSQVFEISQ